MLIAGMLAGVICGGSLDQRLCSSPPMFLAPLALCFCPAYDMYRGAKTTHAACLSVIVGARTKMCTPLFEKKTSVPLITLAPSLRTNCLCRDITTCLSVSGYPVVSAATPLAHFSVRMVTAAVDSRSARHLVSPHLEAGHKAE